VSVVCSTTYYFLSFYKGKKLLLDLGCAVECFDSYITFSMHIATRACKILAVKYLPREEQQLMLRRLKKGAAHTEEWEAKLLIRAMGCIILVDAGISSSKTNTLR